MPTGAQYLAVGLCLVILLGGAKCAESDTESNLILEDGKGTQTNEQASRFVASGRSPARFEVKLGENKADPTKAALELDVRVNELGVGDDANFIVNVHAIGGQTPDKSESTLIGSFSFFPPPKAGEQRSFLVPLPPDQAVQDGKVQLEIEIVPAADGTTIDRSKLEITGVRRVGPS